MPRKGGAYKIEGDWRERVRQGIDAIVGDDGKAISDAEFARRAGISKVTLHQALKATSKQTTVMPQIHEALGWPAPRVVIAPDALEILAMYDAMDPFARGQELEKARQKARELRQARDAATVRNERATKHKR